MAGRMKKEDFEPHLNSFFEVVPKGMGAVRIELVEVKDNSSGVMEAFSLLFRGGKDCLFRHDTHRVRHPVMGEMELFIGPVHTGKSDAIYYQAVFSAPKGA